MVINLGFDLGHALSYKEEISGAYDEEAVRDSNKRLMRQPNRSLKH
jgi:hypothetical protein